MDQEQKSRKEAFLSALHELGVLLAVLKGDRWFGVLADSLPRYWLVEGTVTDPEAIRSEHIETVDHCHFETYEQALEAFRKWWDHDLTGKPDCTGGLLAVHQADNPSSRPGTR